MNAGEARCAVVIVAFNCWQHVFRCLASLDAQTYGSFRIILVDNGDATAEEQDAARRHERVSYVRSEGNVGFASAVNHGVALAAGCEWIAMLNPDAFPSPDWLEKLIAAADAHPACPSFASRLLSDDDPAILDGEGDAYHVSGLAWRRAIGRPVKTEDLVHRETFAACAAAALVRRDVFVAARGLDEDFFCYLEDVDLGFRLRLAGYRCLLIPEAQVRHVGSAATGKRSAFYVYHGQRNLVWTYVKNMPGLLLWLFLPLHVAVNVAGVVRHAFNGNLRAVLKAKYDAVRALPVVWRKRREVQSGRVVSLSQILASMDKHLIPGTDRALRTLWR